MDAGDKPGHDGERRFMPYVNLPEGW
jgi:hypothetical protein